jgi:hypothetical protein
MSSRSRAPILTTAPRAAGFPTGSLRETPSQKRRAPVTKTKLRQWLAAIDARLARHQLTGGRGSVILYGTQDDPAPSVRATRKREARADGINVPFISQVFAVAYDGINWGWTGDPLSAYHTHDGEGLTETHAIAFPEITGWRSNRDDAESRARLRRSGVAAAAYRAAARCRRRTFAPVAVAEADAVRAESFSASTITASIMESSGTAGTSRRAEPSAHSRFAGMAGRAGAAAVWLNGVYLGSAVARDDGTISARMRIAPAALRVNAGNVISVLFENMGHNENLSRDAGRAQSRGMLRAALSNGRGGIAWQHSR